MGYTINFKDLDERINASRISDFFRAHGLQVSGHKQQLWDRMSDAINSADSSLTVEDVDQFLAEEISHGRNRMLFLSSFPAMHVQQLKNLEYVKKCLKEAGFDNDKINNLRTVYESDKALLSFFDYVIVGNEVTQISLCFTKRITEEDQEEECATRGQVDYIWVEIFPLEQRIIIKVWARSNNILENQAESREIYDEISFMVRELFNLAPRDVSWQKATLYNIFRSLTQKAEDPFKKDVVSIKSQVDKLVEACTERLKIQSGLLSFDLSYRISRLFERALIEQNYDLYRKYSDGKRGYVDRIAFSDASGAFVRARSAANKGIEMADIYFDTRDTIEQLKMLDKLWVSWFYKPADNVEIIKTRIEVFKEHYIINFDRTYTTKEVEQHVLSNFKWFENVQNR